MSETLLTQQERLEKAIGHLHFYLEMAKHGGNTECMDDFLKVFDDLASIHRRVFNMNWWE